MTAAKEHNNAHNYGIILLAAGASTRLGRPKQLLPYMGKSLLRHILEVIKEVNTYPVIVVLGADTHLISNEIATYKNIYKVVNESWSEGISSSIRSGLSTLQQIAPETDGALFVVCDQPYITATLLNNLIAAQKETGKPIVASRYEDAFGTPALFHKILFPELMTLKGDQGAKKIIKQYPGSFTTVPFPKGNIDIDTSADYETLKITDIH